MPHHIAPQLEEVPEQPQKPDDRKMKQAIAKNRSNDLQKMFTSRHSDASDRLRSRLSVLNGQAHELRMRIAALEREIQEANNERSKDLHTTSEKTDRTRLSSDDAKDEGRDAKEPMRHLEVAPSRLGSDVPGRKRSSRVGSHDVADMFSDEVDLVVYASDNVPQHPAEDNLSPASHRPTCASVSSSSTTHDPNRISVSTSVLQEPNRASVSASVLQDPHRASVLSSTDMLESRHNSLTSGPDPRRPSASYECEIDFHDMPSIPTEGEDQEDRDGRRSRPLSAEKRYQDEVLMPLLVRRRAEARFKEASLVHENSINQMKVELQEIERRMVKQQNWMKHIDSEVLKVELTKARYQVRLESARKRVDGLGMELSKAYENMNILLEERLEVQDLAAKNDALVQYLHVLGVADQENSKNFIENKEELLSLNEHIKRMREKRATLDDLLEQVRCSQTLSGDIVRRSEELSWLTEQLHQLWNLVPVEWKDSVFKSVQKGAAAPLAMHPVNAIQALQASSKHMSGAMKGYLKSVAEFLDATNAQVHRRRAFKLNMNGTLNRRQLVPQRQDHASKVV